MRFVPMLPPRTFQGAGEHWKGDGRPVTWALSADHNHFSWPRPPPPTRPLLGGRHLDSVLFQPVCSEMKDEERETERDRTRGQSGVMEAEGGHGRRLQKGPGGGTGCLCPGPEGGSYTGCPWVALGVCLCCCGHVT